MNGSFEDGDQKARRKYATDLTDQEFEAIVTLVSNGVSIAACAPLGENSKAEFNFTARRNMKPALKQLQHYRRGYAVIGDTGSRINVIDIDVKGPENGFKTFDQLKHLVTHVIAEVDTPSGGKHFIVPDSGMGTIRFGGIDFLAAGSIVYLGGTDRRKYDGRGYTWMTMPRFIDIPTASEARAFPEALLAMQTVAGPVSRGHRTSKPTQGKVFGPWGVLQWAEDKLAAAHQGTRTQTMYKVSFHVGTVIGDDHDLTTKALISVLSGAKRCGLLDEDGLASCLQQVRNGLDAGASSKDGDSRE